MSDIKINRIAIAAETNDGVVRHVYTKPETRQHILTLINSLEGEIRISDKPVENVKIEDPNT